MYALQYVYFMVVLYMLEVQVHVTYECMCLSCSYIHISANAHMLNMSCMHGLMSPLHPQEEGMPDKY